MGTDPHDCLQEVNGMKFVTIALSTLLTVLTVEAAAKAESISQPQTEEITFLAQRHQGIYRGGNFSRRRLHHRRFQQVPHRQFGNRTFRPFPGRFQPKIIHPRRRFRRRLRPRVKHYPYSHRQSPRYYPRSYPFLRRIYIHRSSFPNQRH